MPSLAVPAFAVALVSVLAARTTPSIAATAAPVRVAGPIGITNAPPARKGALSKAEAAEQARRETAYRAWYHQKYGYDPDDAQVRTWYERAYGLSPS